MDNKQLKKDIAEWQLKADNQKIANMDDHNAILVDEARTLLLRASMSL